MHTDTIHNTITVHGSTVPLQYAMKLPLLSMVPQYHYNTQWNYHYCPWFHSTITICNETTVTVHGSIVPLQYSMKLPLLSMVPQYHYNTQWNYRYCPWFHSTITIRNETTVTVHGSTVPLQYHMEKVAGLQQSALSVLVPVPFIGNENFMWKSDLRECKAGIVSFCLLSFRLLSFRLLRTNLCHFTTNRKYPQIREKSV